MTQYCANNTGRAARLYYNTGTDATPVYVEVTEARDLKLPMSNEEIEDSDRGSSFKLYNAGQTDAAISGQLSYRPGSTNNAYIRDMITSKCSALFYLVTGDITASSTEGWKLPSKIFQHDTDFSLSSSMVIDFTLKPAYYEEASAQVVPEFFVVGS